jgi:hypothetical protein
VGAVDDIDPGGPFGDGGAVLLGEATPDDDGQIGPVRLAPVLLALEVPEGAVEAVVGVLADGAGVEQDEVGVLLGGCAPVAEGLEHAGGAARVVLVHLAPEGADEVAAAGGRLAHACTWVYLSRSSWCSR